MNTLFLKDYCAILLENVKSARALDRLYFYCYLVALLILYGIARSAYGSSPSSPTESSDTILLASSNLDVLYTVFATAAPQWETALIGIAHNLFYILASIELTWTGIRLTLRQAELAEWVSEIVYQVMFIGFFLALLDNSSAWANAIVQSFSTAGKAASANAGGQNGIIPSEAFQIGYDIANQIIEDTPFTKDGDVFFLSLSALIILISAALISAFTTLALIETFLAIYAGILFMGFGGSRFTSQIALKTLMYTFAAGAKLFFIQLLNGLAVNQLQILRAEFLTYSSVNNTIIFRAIGMFVILLIIIMRAPMTLQTMLNGLNFNFNLTPPTQDSNLETNQPPASTPVSVTNTITALKATMEPPAGYSPISSTFFDTTSSQDLPLESLGSRLLDAENTGFHSSAFSQSGSVNTEARVFKPSDGSSAAANNSNASTMTPSNIATSTNLSTAQQANQSTAQQANQSTSQQTNQSTSAGNSTIAATQRGSQTLDVSDNPFAAQSTATSLGQNNPAVSMSEQIQQSDTVGQSAGLGGRFTDGDLSTAHSTDMPNQTGQVGQVGQAGQAGQSDIAGTTSPLGGQQQTGIIGTNSTVDMPNQMGQVGQSSQPGQVGQTEAGIVVTTLPQFGAQQTNTGGTNNRVDMPNQPGSSVQAGQAGQNGQPGQVGQTEAGIVVTTLPQYGDQQTNTGGTNNRVDMPNQSGQTGQSGQAGQNSGSGTTAVPGNQQQTDMPGLSEKDSVAAVAGVSKDMGGKLAADLTNTSADTATSIGMGNPSNRAGQTSVTSSPLSAAPIATPSPTSAAPTSSASTSAAPASSAPVSAVPTSTAPASSAPVSAAPTSAAPASSAPVSAAPTSAAPTSSVPASASPDSKSPAASADGNNKNANGKKAETTSDNKVDLKSAGDNKQDKKVDSNDKKKADNKIKPTDDNKKKSDDPTINDDSFDGKPKKPRHPKDDHRDKK